MLINSHNLQLKLSFLTYMMDTIWHELNLNEKYLHKVNLGSKQKKSGKRSRKYLTGHTFTLILNNGFFRVYRYGTLGLTLSWRGPLSYRNLHIWIGFYMITAPIMKEWKGLIKTVWITNIFKAKSKASSYSTLFTIILFSNKNRQTLLSETYTFPTFSESVLEFSIILIDKASFFCFAYNLRESNMRNIAPTNVNITKEQNSSQKDFQVVFCSKLTIEALNRRNFFFLLTWSKFQKII